MGYARMCGQTRRSGKYSCCNRAGFRPSMGFNGKSEALVNSFVKLCLWSQ